MKRYSLKEMTDVDQCDDFSKSEVHSSDEVDWLKTDHSLNRSAKSQLIKIRDMFNNNDNDPSVFRAEIFKQFKDDIYENENNEEEYYLEILKHEKELKKCYTNEYCQCSKDCKHQLPKEALQHHIPMCSNHRQNIANKIEKSGLTLKNDKNSPPFSKIINDAISDVCKVLRSDDKTFYRETSKKIEDCPDDYFAILLAKIEGGITNYNVSKIEGHMEYVILLKKLKDLLFMYKRQFNPFKPLWLLVTYVIMAALIPIQHAIIADKMITANLQMVWVTSVVAIIANELMMLRLDDAETNLKDLLKLRRKQHTLAQKKRLANQIEDARDDIRRLEEQEAISHQIVVFGGAVFLCGIVGALFRNFGK